MGGGVPVPGPFGPASKTCANCGMTHQVNASHECDPAKVYAHQTLKARNNKEFEKLKIEDWENNRTKFYRWLDKR